MIQGQKAEAFFDPEPYRKSKIIIKFNLCLG